jgi:phosphoglycolate phosphatase-like HAD superfamily hydrolase/rhodanese-related sulfurtransferase
MRFSNRAAKGKRLSMERIILLDIDGVLVRPGGYRAALRAVVERFIHTGFQITEDALNSMEKLGILSEWDMTPLTIASCWEDILSRQPMNGLPDSVSAAAEEIRRRRRTPPARLSIPAFKLEAGYYPAEAAFRAGCFPSIPEPLRKNLLTSTRNVQKSDVTRAIQHFTLGSKHFEEAYRLPSEFETESLLLRHDRPALDSAARAALFQSGNRAAIFTSRPSRPPREAEEKATGYAPEAELALELVGLTELPVTAFGKLEYIAAQRQLDAASLLKPSPFQALAATLSAWTGKELPALNAAYEWLRTGKLNGSFNALPKSFELLVVEDNVSGVRSVQAAGKILRQAGFDVVVRALGLTDGVPEKAAAFKAEGTPHFENWASLLDFIQL